jgi:hypothetical protein
LALPAVGRFGDTRQLLEIQVLHPLPGSRPTDDLLSSRAGESRALPPGRLALIPTAYFFADGKRIVFLGREAGHENRLWVQDLSAGPPRPISEEGIAWPMA